MGIRVATGQRLSLRSLEVVIALRQTVRVRGVSLGIGPGSRVYTGVCEPWHLRRDVPGGLRVHWVVHKPRRTGRCASLSTPPGCLCLFRDGILSHEREEAESAGIIRVALLAVAGPGEHDASLLDGTREVMGRVLVSPGIPALPHEANVRV